MVALRPRSVKDSKHGQPKNYRVQKYTYHTRMSKGRALRRLVERNYPGFTRCADGSLDVTPQGQELEIVRANQKSSPLLRLPAELRAQICEYAHGGNLMAYKRVQSSEGLAIGVGPAKSQNTPHLGADLLRVSRQFYAEAAHIPFANNTFFMPELRLLTTDKGIGMPGSYQQKVIRHIELWARVSPRGQVISGKCTQAYGSHSEDSDNQGFLATHLPALRSLRIRIEPHYMTIGHWREDVKDSLGKLLGGRNVAGRLQITFIPCNQFGSAFEDPNDVNRYLEDKGEDIEDNIYLIA